MRTNCFIDERLSDTLVEGNHENSREENLEILMKACDAIGFAHEVVWSTVISNPRISCWVILLDGHGLGAALPTSSYDKHDPYLPRQGLVVLRRSWYPKW